MALHTWSSLPPSYLQLPEVQVETAATGHNTRSRASALGPFRRGATSRGGWYNHRGGGGDGGVDPGYPMDYPPRPATKDERVSALQAHGLDLSGFLPGYSVLERCRLSLSCGGAGVGGIVAHDGGVRVSQREPEPRWLCRGQQWQRQYRGALSLFVHKTPV